MNNPMFMPSELKNNKKLCLEVFDNYLFHYSSILFIGAGFGFGFGMPSWVILIKRLLEVNGLPDDLSESPTTAELLDAAQRCLDKVKESSEDWNDRFMQEVYDALYLETKDPFSWEGQCASELARSIVCCLNSDVFIKKIFTLNYDDNLERYIKWNGISVSSVIGADTTELRAEISVYHPHGFLPREIDVQRSEDIILTRDSFIKEQIAGVLGPWPQNVLDTFIRNIPVFIGSRASDPMLDLYFTSLSENHKMYNRNIDRMVLGFVLDKSPNDIFESEYDDESKLLYINFENFDQIPEMLIKFCRKKSEMLAGKSSKLMG